MTDSGPSVETSSLASQDTLARATSTTIEPMFLAGFGLLRAPAVAHYQQVLEATGEAAAPTGNAAASKPAS